MAASGTFPLGLAITATALALLFAPGYLAARAWRLRGLLAWGAAPALSLALLTPATLLAHAVGTPWAPAGHRSQSWGWHTLLLGWPAWLLAVAILLGVACTRPWKAQRAQSAAALPLPALTRNESRLLLGALALATILTAVPLWLATGSLHSIPQASDAVFHLAAVRVIREGGNASFLGGLAPLYDGHAVYYPTAWHALASLLPGDAVAGANVLAILLPALLWPLGIAALVRVAVGARGGVLAAGAALAGSVISPALLATSVWPYALSIAVLPGALAVLAWALGPAGCSRWARTCALAIAALACFGVVMAHGAGVFNLLVLATPITVAAVARPLRRHWSRSHHRPWLLALGTLAAAGLLAGVWLMWDALTAVFSFSRGSSNMWETLFALATDHPLLATFTPWIPGNLIVVALAVLGGVVGWRERRLRPWAVAALAAVALLLLAAGPQWAGRTLAGPWYTQRARIMPLVSIGELVLAAAGIARVAASKRMADAVARLPRVGRQASTHLPAVVLIASLLLAPGWRWGLKAEVMGAVHNPEHIAYGRMLASGEEALIERAAQELPAGAVVVGDPTNGSAYLWSVGGVRVLYPIRPEPTWSRELTWVGKNLANFSTDERVCRILKERGVTAYYWDSDSGQRVPLWGSKWQIPAQALREIDSQGTAHLALLDYSASPCG